MIWNWSLVSINKGWEQYLEIFDAYRNVYLNAHRNVYLLLTSVVSCSVSFSLSVILTLLYSVSRLAGVRATLGWFSETPKLMGVQFIWARNLIAKIVLLQTFILNLFYSTSFFIGNNISFPISKQQQHNRKIYQTSLEKFSSEYQLFLNFSMSKKDHFLWGTTEKKFIFISPLSTNYCSIFQSPRNIDSSKEQLQKVEFFFSTEYQLFWFFSKSQENHFHWGTTPKFFFLSPRKTDSSKVQVVP